MAKACWGPKVYLQAEPHPLDATAHVWRAYYVEDDHPLYQGNRDRAALVKALKSQGFRVEPRDLVMLSREQAALPAVQREVRIEYEVRERWSRRCDARVATLAEAQAWQQRLNEERRGIGEAFDIVKQRQGAEYGDVECSIVG